MQTYCSDTKQIIGHKVTKSNFRFNYSEFSFFVLPCQVLVGGVCWAGNTTKTEVLCTSLRWRMETCNRLSIE